MLDLQLHARGEKRRALQQARDHRIGAVADQAAQSLGDAGIFGGEFRALLAQHGEFAIVEVSELVVHAL